MFNKYTDKSMAQCERESNTNLSITQCVCVQCTSMKVMLIGPVRLTVNVSAGVCACVRNVHINSIYAVHCNIHSHFLFHSLMLFLLFVNFIEFPFFTALNACCKCSFVCVLQWKASTLILWVYMCEKASKHTHTHY